MMRPSDLARLAAALGGLPVLGCLAGSPADDAGMRYGDILLAVNGIPTASWDDFLRARNHQTTRIVARVFRQGEEFDLSFELRPSKQNPLEILGELQGRGILPGGESEAEPAGHNSDNDGEVCG